MAKPYRCHCTDWEIDDATPGRLSLRPSSKTVTRSLGGSFLLCFFVGLIVLTFGFPPGCRAVSGERRKLQELEQKLETAERHAQRVATGATAGEPGSIGQSVADQARATADRLKRDVEQQRQRAQQARATLGPVGDTLYWSAVGGLTLLAVAAPWIARRERMTLELEPDGHTLRLTRRGQLRRSRDFDLRRYAGMVVVVQRLMTRGRQGQVNDLGWRWSVVLVSADPGTRWLELVINEDASLPQPFDKLTSRVRQGLRYFETITNLPAAPPLKIDVGSSPNLWSHFESRVERADQPASSASPYRPL